MKRLALILVPASVAVACATVALPAGLGFDGVSPHRVCYAAIGGTVDDDASPTRTPAETGADRCATRPDPESGRS